MKVTKVTHLHGCGIQIKAGKDGEVELHFLDVRQITPDAPPIALELIVIPFDAESWQRFKRQVDADGEISPISVARTIPSI